MTLPQEIAEHIEQQAKKYAQVRCNDFEGKKHLHRKTLLMYAHLAGATEWAEKAQGLIDATEKLNVAIDKMWNECNTNSIPEKHKRQISAAQAECGKALAKYKEVTHG